MSRLRRLRWATAAGLAALALGGCGADPGPAPRGAVGELPAGVHHSFLQERREEGSPNARIRVANTGHVPVHVEGVGLVWPGYAATMGDFAYTVDPGETWDLPFTLSAPDCDHGAPATAPEGAVLVDGDRLVGPIDDVGVTFLTRVWRAQCARMLLDDAVGVSYDDLDGSRIVADRSTLRASLVLSRRAGDEQIRITGNQGSVLFDLRLGRPRTLLSGAEVLRIPLDITPVRCDEHAIGQASQPFFFRYFIAIGEADASYVIVEPDETERELLLDFWHLACGDRTEQGSRDAG